MAIIEREIGPGIIARTGALLRPPDPNETRHLVRSGPPIPRADLSVPHLLSDFHGRDLRVPITGQQNGDCAAFSSETAVRMSRKGAGDPEPVEMHQGWLYEQARRKDFPQTWREDSGSYVATNMDLLLKGAPPRAAHGYFKADYDYPAWMDNAEGWHDYALSHHAVYPMSEGLDAALNAIAWYADQGYAGVFSSWWPGPWFNPAGGWLPENVPVDPQDGGHAYALWGVVPPRDGRPGGVPFSNSWTPRWSADAPQAGWTLRPGDCLMPWSYLTTHIWEIRFVRPEAYALPEPEPEPEPEPTRRVFYLGARSWRWLDNTWETVDSPQQRVEIAPGGWVEPFLNDEAGNQVWPERAEFVPTTPRPSLTVSHG